MEDLNIKRYETKIKLVPSSMKQLNKQFALVDILLCYHGKNRNHTLISKEVIEKALPSLYGIPIIGEYITKDDGSKDFGSHGGRIIIDSSGIRYEQTTKPYGFITNEAVENCKWVNILEKDGHTEHEYLELKGCVVWKDRFLEIENLLEKNYGQSMEISIDKGYYDKDSYYVIDEFTFSAACILGSDVEPCFETANIGRHYEVDSFKLELDYMLNEYKKFLSQTNFNNSNLNYENGGQKVEKEKISSLISKVRYGDNYEKYFILSINENNIYLIDRENSYKLFSIEYVKDNNDIVINWDSKTECEISFIDKSNNNEKSKLVCIYEDIKEKFQLDFDLKFKNEINEITKNANENLDELKNDYNILQNSYNEVIEKLRKFELAEAEKNKSEHIAMVNSILEKFSKKIGKSPEFIFYKAKLDIENVNLDDLERELTLMTGRLLMNKKENKGNFSYSPISVDINKYNKTNDLNKRYGNLLDEFMN